MYYLFALLGREYDRRRCTDYYYRLCLYTKIIPCFHVCNVWLFQSFNNFRSFISINCTCTYLLDMTTKTVELMILNLRVSVSVVTVAEFQNCSPRAIATAVGCFPPSRCLGWLLVSVFASEGNRWNERFARDCVHNTVRSYACLVGFAVCRLEGSSEA